MADLGTYRFQIDDEEQITQLHDDNDGRWMSECYRVMLNDVEDIFRKAEVIYASSDLMAAMIFCGRFTTTNDRQHYVYNTDTFVRKVELRESLNGSRS